ncbi:murein biosynthesis integral membrane protein MurJ [Roseinatronobacter sp. S2]|uniref:murein biosynthesis integral membrane protein MurJ n=1 Tax=Roseinatronobacter sp. S2 TaxID=3035471 RepID=UPI00240FC33B|nr:murein biosynthesis integral membrane protein MurJ [Roseinatronobacter sp. S2]WFE77288.1 murein biosynthesis integral membrane protein MurJ [Roseinatronobacter sp. S2]
MLRKLGIVSGLTLISRVLGFLRDMVLAAALGAGPVADAFMLAFRLPNHFRAILAEGAFNAAFLPTWATADAGGRDTSQLGAQVLGWLLLTNLMLLTLALGATGWVLAALAPGLSATDETWPLAVTLTRITFPYLLCMSLVSFLSALLNGRDHFAAPAAAPILLNLFMIGALLLAAHFPTAAHAAAWGVMLSGVGQVALVALACRRAALPLPLPRLGLSADTRLFFRRLGPAVLTSGALQVAVFADTIIVTFLPPGSLSHLYYADRLYQLPIGLIGVALGTVILPDIGRRAGLGDEAGIRHVLDRALFICLAVGMPVAVIMVTLGDWTMRLLFMRGAFDLAAADAAAAILAAYAIGLVPALAIRSLVAGFHGRGDTSTPLSMLVLATAVNIAVKISLAPSVGAVGLALGTTVGITVYAFLLWRTARVRGVFKGPRLSDVGLFVASGVATGLLVLWSRGALMVALGPVLGQWSMPIAFIVLTFAVVAVQVAVILFCRRAKVTGGTPPQ